MIEEVCAGGIVINDGKVAVAVQKNDDGLSLPKGHVEEGETIEQAARREIFEEVGISDLNLVKYLGSYGRPVKNQPNVHKTVHLFYFTTTQTELKSNDPDSVEVKWVPLEDLFTEAIRYPEDQAFYLQIKDELK